jgi:hypothetical protein
MSSAGLEPAIPAIERLQTYALGSTATDMGRTEQADLHVSGLQFEPCRRLFFLFLFFF